MIKKTVKAVMKSCPAGGHEYAGYTTEEVPAGLMAFDAEVLDMEDGNIYVLGAPDAIPLLDAAALTALCTTSDRNAAIAKLSDADLVALGLSR